VDVSWSPLTDLLSDRCTPELRRLQAELSARHSYREAARLLEMLLPCAPANHATMRNRTHRVAADLEAAAPPALDPAHERPTEIMMAIDGAHIRAAHGYQSRHIDVTVGKIEVEGRPPRRFALAPKGASAPFGDIAEGAAGARMAARPKCDRPERRRICAAESGPRRRRRTRHLHSGLVAYLDAGSAYRASATRRLCRRTATSRRIRNRRVENWTATASHTAMIYGAI
jgi:hypothetical protein